MPLRTGDGAPPFGVRDLDGNPVTAGEDHPLWLAFFRSAACPFCAVRVKQILKRYDDIENCAADFVAVFPSPRAKIDKYLSKFQPRFRIISDPEEKLYEKYQAEASWLVELRTAVNLVRVARALGTAPNNPFAIDGKFNRVPCEFLIHGGTIRHAYYGKTLDDGESVDTMLEKVAALR